MVRISLFAELAKNPLKYFFFLNFYDRPLSLQFLGLLFLLSHQSFSKFQTNLLIYF